MDFTITSVVKTTVETFFDKMAPRLMITANVKGSVVNPLTKEPRVTNVTIYIKERDLQNDVKLKEAFMKSYNERLESSYSDERWFEARKAERAQKEQEEAERKKWIGKVIDP
jgi:hypothetical protein